MVRGVRPVLALVVEIDQVFSHCAKAFMRSRLWEAESWPAPDAMPSVAEMCVAIQSPEETLEELQAHYAPEHYETLLYLPGGSTPTPQRSGIVSPNSRNNSRNSGSEMPMTLL